MKIVQQKGFTLTEADRLDLVRVLAKAGYSVRIVKEKVAGKTTNVVSVEFLEVSQ